MSKCQRQQVVGNRNVSNEFLGPARFLKIAGQPTISPQRTRRNNGLMRPACLN